MGGLQCICVAIATSFGAIVIPIHSCRVMLHTLLLLLLLCQEARGETAWQLSTALFHVLTAAKVSGRAGGPRQQHP